MRGTAVTLLAILAASCSPEPRPSLENLVDVAGSVSLRNGPPLARVTVSFFTPGTGRPPSPLAPDRPGSRIHATPPLATWTGTDMDGIFRIRLPEGRWEVWIGGPADSGVVSQHVADVTLQLPSANLELHYLGYRISGRLVGPGDATIKDGHLSITTRANTTGVPVPFGSYTLLVPPDTLSILANPSPIGYEAGIPHVRYDGIVASSDTVIDLFLDGHLVSGRATGPNGIPLYGGWVSASSATATGYHAFAADGSYGIYLPTGEYAFTVYTGGRGDGTHVYPPMLIDAPRTLDFDLPGTAPVP